jgi:glycosyltransferase involved in cell wall biosynthesis
MANKKPRNRRAQHSVGRQVRPTLALCVIARNEERFIADCLDSARDFVDEMIVVDTGSTDRTREIAREHGARVEEFVWCDDFAAARNAAIDAATSDWILMLDADERLDLTSGSPLRALIRIAPPHLHALVPLIENRTLSGSAILSSACNMPRIFPRRPDIRFIGAIHEDIVYVPDSRRTMMCRAPEIRLIHYGYDEQVVKQRSKDARNVALLERELERGSADPRMLFHLLEQHVVSGREAQAVDAFALFASKAGSLSADFWVEAYNFYLIALIRLGDNARVEVAALEAAQRGILGAAALSNLSKWYVNLGDVDRAIDYLSRLLNTTAPAGLREVEGLADWQTRLRLAELYHFRDGSSEVATEALQHAEIAYAQSPVDQRSGIALEVAEAALLLDDVAAAGLWAERALCHETQNEVAQRQLLDLLVRIYARDGALQIASPFAAIDRALACDDLQSMYDLAFGLPSTMAGVVRCVAVVERLHSAGEAEAAIGLLNRALDGPRVEQVYWLLIKTFTDLGRYEDAQLALEALRNQFQKLAA